MEKRDLRPELQELLETVYFSKSALAAALDINRMTLHKYLRRGDCSMPLYYRLVLKLKEIQEKAKRP